MMAPTVGRALAALLLAAGCAGLRSTPETRYQGRVLDARTLGAAELERALAKDPTVRAWVAAHGPPDYVYVGRPTDLELVYLHPESRLVHFHRPTPDAPSTTSELSPLPLEVTNVLPVDIRAGAPGDIREPGPPTASCWTVEVRSGSCRTCCVTSAACSTECRPAGS
ncbi:MAG TPA: hypothetical protein VFD84_04565 [Candidatus Binatia bacterium]|nr:hypothetical protein [Candidatus Binatia bacterium]